MHEKDVKLTKLLLKEHKERQGKLASLMEELSTAKQELDSVMEIRQEREGMQDVLSRAAALLEREDLGVELPESEELEGRVGEMESQLSETQSEIKKYDDILNELKEKAPELIKLAGGMDESEPPSQPDDSILAEDSAPPTDPEPHDDATPPDDPTQGDDPMPPDDPTQGDDPMPPDDPTQAEDSTEAHDSTVEEDQGSSEAPPPEDADGGGPEQAADGPEQEDERGQAHEILSKLNKRERRKLLSVFKLKSLTEKEAYAHGRGAVYLVDTKSIFAEVQAYDYANPNADLTTIHSRLALQFYGLSLELSGSFHLVFDATFPDQHSFGNLVIVDAVEGGEEEYAKVMRELVGKYSGKLRTVCLVTGDHELAESIDGQGVHLIPLDDFFF